MEKTLPGPNPGGDTFCKKRGVPVANGTPTPHSDHRQVGYASMWVSVFFFHLSTRGYLPTVYVCFDHNFLLHFFRLSLAGFSNLSPGQRRILAVLCLETRRIEGNEVGAVFPGDVRPPSPKLKWEIRVFTEIAMGDAKIAVSRFVGRKQFVGGKRLLVTNTLVLAPGQVVGVDARFHLLNLKPHV